MAIIVYGINHSTAPVEIREKLSFSEPIAKATIKHLVSKKILKEAVLLSTCNRTEVYGVVEDRANLNGQISRQFQLVKNIQENISEELFYQKNEQNAVSHLFRVASSLDSMIVGDAQILGQTKQAYIWATEAETSDSLLNRLFHSAFRTAKRVRSETKIGEGSTSVGLVAVNLAQKLFRDFVGKKVVLVGAGKMGQQVIRQLSNFDSLEIFILNRTPAKAEELANRVNGQALPFDQLHRALIDADIVITSTSASQPVLTPVTVKNAMLRRKNRPLFFIDIAVPRNIDPRIKEIYNTYLFDIDDLQNIVKKNMGKRKKEIPKAEKILAEEVDRFMQWYRSRNTIYTIRQLQEHFDSLRKEEIRRSKKHFKDEELADIDKFSKSLMKKFLHSPIMRLKTCPETEVVCRRCTIKEVFGLENECLTEE